jgi:signal peptide peptidase SppA
MRFDQIAKRVFCQPVMITQAAGDAIAAGLMGLVGKGGDTLDRDLLTTVRGEYKTPGYRVTAGGVAVIEVMGVLAHRGQLTADCTYIQGYQDIARKLDTAMSDPEVRGIVMVFDSPGGEVSGVFELASMIRQSAQTKPIWGSASDQATSAAYLLLAATSKVAITETSVTGSIGVRMMHIDMSEALAKEGLKVTPIFAGEKKVAANSFQPLSDEDRGYLQGMVTSVYDLFTSAVADYRKIPVSAVVDTQAAVYSGTDAFSVGLADVVATPDQMIRQMEQSFSKKPASRGTKMTGQTEEKTYTQAEYDKGVAEARTAGMNDERARFNSILSAEEAKGKTELAVTVANTGVALEDAKKILAAAPAQTPQQAEAAPNQFAQHMAQHSNANVPADPKRGDEGSAQIQNAWGSVLAK